jgi:hypothetical protein
MAGLEDDQVFAMVGVRPVPIDRHLAAHPAVIEGKGAEVLHQQRHRVALAFVRAEGP